MSPNPSFIMTPIFRQIDAFIMLTQSSKLFPGLRTWKFVHRWSTKTRTTRNTIIGGKVAHSTEIRTIFKVKSSKVKVTRQCLSCRCNVVNVKPFNRRHHGRGHTVSATQLDETVFKFCESCIVYSYHSTGAGNGSIWVMGQYRPTRKKKYQ